MDRLKLAYRKYVEYFGLEGTDLATVFGLLAVLGMFILPTHWGAMYSLDYVFFIAIVMIVIALARSGDKHHAPGSIMVMWIAAILNLVEVLFFTHFQNFATDTSITAFAQMKSLFATDYYGIFIRLGAIVQVIYIVVVDPRYRGHFTWTGLWVRIYGVFEDLSGAVNNRQPAPDTQLSRETKEEGRPQQVLRDTAVASTSEAASSSMDEGKPEGSYTMDEVIDLILAKVRGFNGVQRETVINAVQQVAKAAGAEIDEAVLEKLHDLVVKGSIGTQYEFEEVAKSALAT